MPDTLDHKPQNLREFVDHETRRAGDPHKGKALAARRLIEAVETAKIAPSAFSVRALYESFVGPLATLPAYADARNLGTLDRFDAHVALPVREAAWSSGLFSFVTGSVLQKAMRDSFELATRDGIADSLVESFTSNQPSERITGIQALPNAYETPEGAEYKEVGATDKAVEAPEPAKKGLMVSVTEETIIFDKTGQVLMKARALGEVMAEDREDMVVKSIADQSTNYSYYPIVAGTPTRTAYYRASAGTGGWYDKNITLKELNGLATYKNIDACRLVLAAQTDEEGRRIIPHIDTLLVPETLRQTALRIVGASQVRYDENASAGTASYTEVTPSFLQKLIGSPMQIVVSTVLDGISTSTWYMGSPKRVWKEQVILPLQLAQDDGGDARLSRDVVARFRARHKRRVTGVGCAYWCQNTA